MVRRKAGSQGEVIRSRLAQIMARILRGIGQRVDGLLTAIQEHHRWIESPRARALEEWSQRISVLLEYGAWIAFGVLAYRLWVEVMPLAVRVSQAAPEISSDMLEVRSSLFHVFAAAFLVPAGLFVVWFLVKWVYRMLEAGAFNLLPRFTKILVYPVTLCVVALLAHGYRTPIATLLAQAYVQSRSTVAAAANKPAWRLVESGQPAPQANDTSTAELIEALRKRSRDRDQVPELMLD